MREPRSRFPWLPPAPEFFNPLSTVDASAGALRTALYHVYDKKPILARLRAELATIDTRDLKALEQLPYLKAVLMEGLRISPALGTRLSRVAPG